MLTPLSTHTHTHKHRYAKRPSGMLAPGIYDPTEIFNHGESKKLTIECIGKLAFYMVSFFYYLYWCEHTCVCVCVCVRV